MCGTWRILGKINDGGNGDVYHCQGPGGIRAAIKILRRDHDRRGDRMPRFRNEIRFLTERKNYPGVLPMLDHALPDDPDLPSWYVMPYATPLRKALGQAPDLAVVVDAIARIAHTLANLAADGIEGHRDIKPDNLFQLDGRPVIGDFGLVKYPEQHTGTRQGRPLGPADFMAPEMRRNADTAGAQPADVYSLAKTLWALAANRRYPPEGELRGDRAALRLSSRVDDRRAVQLDLLIERCTSHEPTERPTMRELAEELTAWSAPSSVSIQTDLSAYADEIARLREANHVRGENERQRRVRLYNEAITLVHSRLTVPLMAAVQQSRLQNMGSPPQHFNIWVPDGYGGSQDLPCWGIETLASPRLVASIGVFFKLPSVEETTDLAITALFATVTEDSQQTLFQEIEILHAGPLQLDQAINNMSGKFNNELPAIIAHYLTTCREAGIPRND
jgi:hypothetical protein